MASTIGGKAPGRFMGEGNPINYPLLPPYDADQFPYSESSLCSLHIKVEFRKRSRYDSPHGCKDARMAKKRKCKWSTSFL